MSNQLRWDGPIAIIGAGQLGSSMMEGLLQAGVPAADIRVATGRPAHAQALAADFGVHAAPAAEAVSGATLIALATRADQMEGVLFDFAEHVDTGAVVVSLAAEPDIARMQEILPAGTAVVRIMPNPPMAVGASVMGYTPAPDLPQEIGDRVRELLGHLGQVIEVPEERIGTVSTLAGHGMATLYYATDALVQWAVMNGFSRAEAREAAGGIVAGVAASLTSGDPDPVTWQDRLCTPGGTTVQTVAELDAAGVRGAIIAAMDGGRFAS